jgi:collagenase-like PrtC family protease
MRFAIGYQLAEPGEESFVEIVRDYLEHVAEVYFPWGSMPSGRAALTERRGYVDWGGQARLEEDLIELRAMGVRLNLLLNANCYGRLAASEYLANQVVSVVRHLERVLDGPLEVVTTASPAIARTLAREAPGIDVRASVNMRIGTVQGMGHAAGLFGSFCVQRDCNRDLAHLGRLKRWAEANGKRLSLLANSGCLAFCPGQVFHDNMVAHEAEIDETRNVAGSWPIVCRERLRDRAAWPAILQATWIRPEDVDRYEGLYDVMKLATRMHSNPRLVIDAYSRGEHRGNLLDLLEPGFAGTLAPYAVMNERLPADFFERTTTCGRVCEECDYCRAALEGALVRLGADGL